MSSKSETSIGISKAEYALLKESKDLAEELTGVKISWGAYLTFMGIGALGMEALNGVHIRCSNCGKDVQMILKKPRLKRLPRRSRNSE